MKKKEIILKSRKRDAVFDGTAPSCFILWFSFFSIGEANKNERQQQKNSFNL